MSHQGNKRQKHSPSSSGPSDPETAPHENKDSLRAELQNDLQSQVDQLKEKIAQFEGEASWGEAEKLELKQSVGRLENENSQLKSNVASLEEKVKSLENLVSAAERKEKYHEIVKRNEHWEYPLAAPTVAEMMSVGYTEEQSEEIIMKIDYIEDVTTKMRKGEAINWIDVVDAPVEPHFYEGMLPHYEQFANALTEYKHTIDYMQDNTFHFVIGWAFQFDMGGEAQAQVPTQILLWLEKALKHTHFHRLEFRRIQTEGVRYLDFILNCLKENTRLEAFRLVNVTIENSRDIDLLCEVLNNKASLQEMKLVICGTEGGVFREIFNKLRTKNLHNIDLSENHLSNLRPTDISDFLSSNPSLEELDLSNNPFNERDIVNITDALKHNTTLRRLRIWFWDRDLPTTWGRPANLYLLESAIYDSTSLNAASDSNHHCNLWLGTIGESYIDNFNTCHDHTLNRRKKIYTLLSKRNRHRENASFFELDGIGIKHIPKILSLLRLFSEHHSYDEESIQGQDEVKPLSIAYEIMRDWRMPELYNLDIMEED
eukprot:scaffold40761_cov34-Cyclotella_meneghiniana.AAC.2